MGHYTVYEEDWIDEQISSQLGLITETILKNIAGVKSIILTGGFGRGEGSIKFIGNKMVMPLKDYDIVVVVEEVPSEKDRRKLQRKIYSKLGIEDPESSLFRFSKFVVDIMFNTKNSLTSPDISDYELKAASSILYGEDIRNLNPWGYDDIPLSSGLRLLFEKATGLIGQFSYNYLRSVELEGPRKEGIIYECNKTFMEIATALCILMRKYTHTYVGRMKIFREHYKTDLPCLYKQLPDLPERVTSATLFKLRPDFSLVKMDPIDLWFDTRNYLEIVLRYYLEKFLNSTFSDWISFPEKARSTMWHNYLRPFIRNFTRKIGIEQEGAIAISNIVSQIIMNINYMHQILRRNGTLYLHPLLRPQAPAIKVFLAAPLILFSISRNGSLHEDYLEKAREELRYCIPSGFTSLSMSEWDILRSLYLEAYKLHNSSF